MSKLEEVYLKWSIIVLNFFSLVSDIQCKITGEQFPLWSWEHSYRESVPPSISPSTKLGWQEVLLLWILSLLLDWPAKESLSVTVTYAHSILSCNSPRRRSSWPYHPWLLGQLSSPWKKVFLFHEGELSKSKCGIEGKKTYVSCFSPFKVFCKLS